MVCSIIVALIVYMSKTGKSLTMYTDKADPGGVHALTVEIDKNQGYGRQHRIVRHTLQQKRNQ